VREFQAVRPVALFVLLALLGPMHAFTQEKPPVKAAPPPPAAEAGTATGDMGTLVVHLAGNRKFCVDRNEVGAKPGTVKPRQERSSPLVTTFGYKYQISASRRGTSSIIKLMESPTTRTAYMQKQAPRKSLPQPRLATPKDLKAINRPFGGQAQIARWIPESTCTTLAADYSFPLAPGHYDIYLGFDVLVSSGQWLPLQSDYVTDVTIDKDLSTRVDGRVDYTDGVRTVKMESSRKPSPPAKR
jgi:hypothetical protein